MARRSSVCLSVETATIQHCDRADPSLCVLEIYDYPRGVIGRGRDSLRPSLAVRNAAQDRRPVCGSGCPGDSTDTEMVSRFGRVTQCQSSALRLENEDEQMLGVGSEECRYRMTLSLSLGGVVWVVLFLSSNTVFETRNKRQTTDTVVGSIYSLL